MIDVDRGYTHRLEDLVFTPIAIEGIMAFNNAGYRVFVISNQSGVVHGYCTVEDVERFHAAMQQRLHACEAHIDRFYYCPFHPEGSVPGYPIGPLCAEEVSSGRWKEVEIVGCEALAF